MSEQNSKQSDKKNGVNLENDKTYRIIEFKVRNFGNKVQYEQKIKKLNNIGGYKNQYNDNSKSI